MTLTFTTYIDDNAYYIEAEVSKRRDNLGVERSDFDETVINWALVYHESTGEFVDLEANRAFKKDVHEIVLERARDIAW